MRGDRRPQLDRRDGAERIQRRGHRAPERSELSWRDLAMLHRDFLHGGHPATGSTAGDDGIGSETAGSQNVTLVPAPGCDATFHQPPAS
jgi:hypothetical protein